MKWTFPIAAMLAATVAPAQAPSTPAQTIIYESGPCFGSCPSYRLVVNSNGSGIFEGRRFTAVTGTRPFHFTPAQYRDFARRLAPLRPARGSVHYEGEACRQMATDQPTVRVNWRSPRGEQDLSFYYGCDMERNRAIANTLSAAPRLLPIGDFIGPAR